LTAADPDFPMAPPIKEALFKYIDGGYLSYGPAEGLESFREAVAKDYERKNQVTYASELILPVDSAAFGIYLTCKAFNEVVHHYLWPRKFSKILRHFRGL